MIIGSISERTVSYISDVIGYASIRLGREKGSLAWTVMHAICCVILTALSFSITLFIYRENSVPRMRCRSLDVMNDCIYRGYLMSCLFEMSGSQWLCYSCMVKFIVVNIIFSIHVSIISLREVVRICS